MKKLMCDPPSGWKYGFPKEIPHEISQDGGTRNWLLENGYPQHEIDSCGDYFFVRFWEVEDK
jgi:hypothetical protein